MFGVKKINLSVWGDDDLKHRWQKYCIFYWIAD
jgi:hypothetical protein